MEKKPRRKALHRGLKALISQESAEPKVVDVKSDNSNSLSEVLIKDITKNPYQPRKEFDKEELENLKSSIEQHGVIEPIVLRKSKDKYQIVSGERRFRATELLGFDKIPAVIRKKVSDREMHVLAIVENQQRSDLNDLEIALGYNELIIQYQYKHDEIAKDMGKSRAFVSNTLRLLKLSPNMQQAIANKIIFAGHARAILSIDSEKGRETLFQKIVEKSLSVRQAEELAKSDKNENNTIMQEKKSIDIIDLESKLNYHFNTKVNISNGKKGGKININFTDTSDLNRILDIIKI